MDTGQYLTLVCVVYSSSIVLPGSVYGQYLTLMCQLEPDRVTQFISEQDTFDQDGYLRVSRYKWEHQALSFGNGNYGGFGAPYLY